MISPLVTIGINFKTRKIVYVRAHATRAFSLTHRNHALVLKASAKHLPDTLLCRVAQNGYLLIK